MAIGTHWEWRAFGSVPLSAILNVVGSYDKHFGPEDRGRQHTDEYLWAPGCDVNVKLRDKELKFKRVIEKTDDGCELWTEEEDETFPFPLSDPALDFIRTHMQVDLPKWTDEIRGSLRDFKRSLPSCNPPIRTVPVKKHRIQYDCPIGDATLLVELAEVMDPVPIWSVSIEGEDLIQGSSSGIDKTASRRSLGRISEVRGVLGLPGRMTVKGYLEMLAEW